MVNRAYQGNGKYIFVSYSHKDEKKVYKFIEVLQQKYNVWYDEGIKVGKDWDKEIAEKLINCSIFIFCITKNSLESSNCMDEINHAKNKGKTFINILMDDIELPDSFIFRFSRYQMLNLFEYEDYGDALTVLEKNTDEMAETIKGDDAVNVVLTKPKKKKKVPLILFFSILIIAAVTVFAVIFLNRYLPRKPELVSFTDGVIDNDNILYVVDEDVLFKSIEDNVKVNGNSSWKLFYDSGESIEIKSKVAQQLSGTLNVGDNIFYLFIYNGKDKKMYTLNVHRSHLVNLNYYNGDNLLKTEQIKSGFEYQLEYKIEEEGKLFNYWILNDTPVTSIRILYNSNVYAYFSDEAYSVSYSSTTNNRCAAGKIDMNGDTIEAITNEGYSFVGWYLNDELISTEAKITFQSNLSARWTYYTLTIIEYGHNVIDETSSRYSSGKTIILKSTDYTDKSFIGWYINDELLSNDSLYEYVMPSKDVTITCKYNVYSYNVSVNNHTSLSVTGAGIHLSGESITLETDNTSTKYVVWKQNNVCVGVGNNYEFKMPGQDIILDVYIEDIAQEVDGGILFGRYPQSRVTSSQILNDLNSKYNYGDHYYLWTTYGNFKYAIVDDNNDGILDYFGYYEKTTTWYNYEPVKWATYELDNGTKYILSDLILDESAFLPGTEEYYNYNGNIINEFGLNYKDSTVRSYILSFMYEVLFNDAEKMILNEWLVDNDTKDKLFIPSQDELNERSISGGKEKTDYLVGFSDNNYTEIDGPKAVGGDSLYGSYTTYTWFTRTIIDDRVKVYSSAYNRTNPYPSYYVIGIALACVIS